MADETKETVSATGVDDVKQSDNTSNDKKYIPADVYENVKNDMLKYKQEKRELLERLEKLEQIQKEKEQKELEEQKRFQELYEKEKQEKERLTKQWQQAQINNALKLEALKQGMIDADDVKLVDVSNVIFNIESGQVEGVSEAVAKLKELKPYLFKSNEPSKVNTNIGVGNTKSTTDVVTKYEDLLNNETLLLDYMTNHRETYERLKAEYFRRRRK